MGAITDGLHRSYYEGVDFSKTTERIHNPWGLFLCNAIESLPQLICGGTNAVQNIFSMVDNLNGDALFDVEKSTNGIKLMRQAIQSGKDRDEIKKIYEQYDTDPTVARLWRRYERKNEST